MLLIGPSIEIQTNKRIFVTRWVSYLRTQPPGRVSYIETISKQWEFQENCLATLTICFQEIGLAVLFRCRSPFFVQLFCGVDSEIFDSSRWRRQRTLFGHVWRRLVVCRLLFGVDFRKSKLNSIDTRPYI